MTNEEIQAIFFVECDESLEVAENGLAACRAGTHDGDTVNGIFRAVHSIKGGAGAFGFSALQAFTHGFETLLSDVRDGSLAITDTLVALMQRALDTLSDHVAAARSGSQAPDDAALLAELAAARADDVAPAAEAPVPETPPAEQASQPDAADLDFDLDAMLNDIAEQPAQAVDTVDLDFDLDAMLNDIAEEAAPVAAPWYVRVRPFAGAMNNGGEPLLLLRELRLLGGQCIACETDTVPSLDAFDPQEAYLAWTWEIPAEASEAQIRETFDFVGDDCEVVFLDQKPTVGMVAPTARPEPVPVSVQAPEAGPVSVQVPETAPVAVATADRELPAAPPPAPALAPAAATPTAVTSAPAVSAANQSIRIDLVKLDRLIDSVGELVIAQAMMAQRLAGHGLGGIEEIALLDGLTRDIQESAMAIRAQPIGSVFSRVPRILRELETSTGKRVALSVTGEGTELDKTVIERLGEPMTHLIRNAVDHGIESRDDRIAAGKSAEGTLSLSAEQRSGRVIIRIADDGKGIDRERVFAKAVERGLVAADAQLSNEEIDNLIFAPGFSTAATVSSVSGRGVGMDVVRQNVKDLGGRVTIESEPGKGTTFTLALPLTLAISDGMIVTVGDQTLVVPLAYVVESLRPDPAEVHRLGAGRHMLNVRGQFIPVLPLESAIGARGAEVDPTRGVLIVVDTEAAGQAALLVDTICDQRQFVIKSLDTHYRTVDGVAGATILGDGRVALILDVDGLVANAVAETMFMEAAE
jgi:two-component system chemotaxis sensor kinase CheA